MTEQDIIDFFRDALSAGVIMIAPLMIVALIVGLIIGVLQALTSVQETTLTFAPKLVVMLIVFWITVGSMGRTLVTFFDSRVIPMIAGG
ncbi:MAG: flagellar biosynthetic protein FliQ [Parvularculaceae bacterium]